MKPCHCTDNLWWDHALFSIWCVHCPCSSGYKCSFSNAVRLRITPGLITTDSESSTWSFSQSSYIHHDHGPRQRVTHSSYHLCIIIIPWEGSPSIVAFFVSSSSFSVKGHQAIVPFWEWAAAQGVEVKPHLFVMSQRFPTYLGISFTFLSYLIL